MKNLIETKESIYIPNIQRLEWGKNTDISLIKSAQFALNALGENYSYEFLMGISGAAFRFHFNADWCPSAGDATTGFDVSNVLFKSLGYEYELNKIDDNSFDDIRFLYKKIIVQINKGIPIVAINLKVCPEWGIITGYLKNKPGILCRTYFDESDEYSLAEHAPWLSFFIGKKGKPLDEDEIFKNSLKIAIQLAKTDEFGDYKSGFSAFEKWIDELKTANSKGFKEIEVNLTLFYYLIDARQSAVKYLMSMKDKMKEGNAIIENYEREVELLKTTSKNILPNFKSKPKDWTENIINHQIDVLTKVLMVEKEIIGMIEEYL